MTVTSQEAPRPPCLLVVDDQLPNRRLLISMLKTEGYEFIEAENGREAVELIQHRPVDIVLLDAMMPVLDGVETCRVVREELNKPLLPIVMITALADHDSRARAKTAGVDDFVSKPVYRDELLARVRTLLRVQSLHKQVDEQRQLAEADARVWRLVSRVAGEVALARTQDEIKDGIIDLLKDDLPVESIECGFLGDGDVVPSMSEELLSHIGRFRDEGDQGPVTAEGGETHLYETESGGAFFPLSTGKCIDGGLLVQSRGTMTAADRLLLEALAPHLANAIARVRLLRANEDIEKARDRLAAMLAHDFKNPLSIIKINLEMVRTSVTFDDREMACAIDESVVASDQILRMVLDLIDINRAEGGLLPFSPGDNDLSGVICAATMPFRRLTDRVKARLVTSIEPGVRATFDEALITRVVQNLLSNAVRFVRAGGVVEVGVRLGDDGVTITVANDGPSIPVNHRHEIFRKYGVLSHDAQRTNRGLGLHLCSLVVERHSGSISVDDRVGGGACFTVRLPRALHAH